MKLKVIIGLIVLVCLSATAIACIQTDGTAAKAEISVINKELTKDSAGQTVLLVTVKNTGRVKADFAEVTVRFYDAGKNLIDSNRDSVMTLNPDETWEFSIPCNSDISQIASYEVETTTGAGGGGL